MQLEQQDVAAGESRCEQREEKASVEECDYGGRRRLRSQTPVVADHPRQPVTEGLPVVDALRDCRLSTDDREIPFPTGEHQQQQQQQQEQEEEDERRRDDVVMKRDVEEERICRAAVTAARRTASESSGTGSSIVHSSSSDRSTTLSTDDTDDGRLITLHLPPPSVLFVLI